MILTKIDKDYITINELNIKNSEFLKISKIHIIKLNFNNPNKYKIDEVISLYPNTNRFVISNNIKIYNNILKRTLKKYYIENNENDKLISFIRRNNKILVNFNKLDQIDKNYISNNNVLKDLLNNIEIIQVDEKIYNNFKNIFELWGGNLIIG